MDEAGVHPRAGSPRHVHDFHTTIPHSMRWTMRPTPTATYRLTDMHGHIVKEILSV